MVYDSATGDTDADNEEAEPISMVTAKSLSGAGAFNK